MNLHSQRYGQRQRTGPRQHNDCSDSVPVMWFVTPCAPSLMRLWDGLRPAVSGEMVASDRGGRAGTRKTLGPSVICHAALVNTWLEYLTPAGTGSTSKLVHVWQNWTDTAPFAVFTPIRLSRTATFCESVCPWYLGHYLNVTQITLLNVKRCGLIPLYGNLCFCLLSDVWGIKMIWVLLFGSCWSRCTKDNSPNSICCTLRAASCHRFASFMRFGLGKVLFVLSGMIRTQQLSSLTKSSSGSKCCYVALGAFMSWSHR